MPDSPAYAAYKRRLHRILAFYILALIAFLLLMAWAEQSGLSRRWLGPIFLFSTVMMYGGIGIYGRTADPEEYYVAGRRIPPVYNGMAAAADWMSAASFISLAGGLYLQGFGGTETQAGGLAYVLGWTGGFCLVALLIAPHLRKLNLYTVPDYFKERFGGRWPRRIAAFSAVLCSFTYVVAQIYGIGWCCARSWAACGPSPGPRWRSTSSCCSPSSSRCPGWPTSSWATRWRRWCTASSSRRSPSSSTT
jgi:cation/acetate symporter